MTKNELDNPDYVEILRQIIKLKGNRKAIQLKLLRQIIKLKGNRKAKQLKLTADIIADKSTLYSNFETNFSKKISYLRDNIHIIKGKGYNYQKLSIFYPGCANFIFRNYFNRMYIKYKQYFKEKNFKELNFEDKRLTALLKEYFEKTLIKNDQQLTLRKLFGRFIIENGKNFLKNEVIAVNNLEKGNKICEIIKNNPDFDSLLIKLKTYLDDLGFYKFEEEDFLGKQISSITMFRMFCFCYIQQLHNLFE